MEFNENLELENNNIERYLESEEEEEEEEKNNTINISYKNLYFKEIKDFPVLSKEEQLQLFLDYKQNNNEKAREKLINCNLKLVLTVAKKMMTNLRHVSFMDLVQEGNAGLVKAVEKFNPDKDVKFSSYARWWIKESIVFFLLQNNQIKIPTSSGVILYEINKNIEKYGNTDIDFLYKLQKEKNPNLSIEHFKFLYSIKDNTVSSLDQNIQDKDHQEVKGTGLDSISDNRLNPEQEASYGQDVFYNKLQEFFLFACTNTKGELDKRAYYILVKYFISDDKPTYEELGRDPYVMSLSNNKIITRERVRQIISSAVNINGDNEKNAAHRKRIKEKLEQLGLYNILKERICI